MQTTLPLLKMNKYSINFYDQKGEKVLEIFGTKKDGEEIENVIKKFMVKIPPFIKETITDIKVKFVIDNEKPLNKFQKTIKNQTIFK
jgi:hypothetical protein